MVSLGVAVLKYRSCIYTFLISSLGLDASFHLFYQASLDPLLFYHRLILVSTVLAILSWFYIFLHVVFDLDPAFFSLYIYIRRCD